MIFIFKPSNLVVILLVFSSLHLITYLLIGWFSFKYFLIGYSIASFIVAHIEGRKNNS